VLSFIRIGEYQLGRFTCEWKWERQEWEG